MVNDDKLGAAKCFCMVSPWSDTRGRSITQTGIVYSLKMTVSKISHACSLDAPFCMLSAITPYACCQRGRCRPRLSRVNFTIKVHLPRRLNGGCEERVTEV